VKIFIFVRGNFQIYPGKFSDLSGKIFRLVREEEEEDNDYNKKEEEDEDAPRLLVLKYSKIFKYSKYSKNIKKNCLPSAAPGQSV